MNRLKWGYRVSLTFFAVLGLLYLSGYLSSGILAGNGMVSYVLNTVAVILTLAAIYSGVRLFKFKKVRESVTDTDEPAARKKYIRWNVTRYVAMGITFLFDFSTAYLLADDSGLYAGIIVFISLVFCSASEDDFQLLRNPETKEKP